MPGASETRDMLDYKGALGYPCLPCNMLVDFGYDLPFALAINLVFAEGDVFQTRLASGVVQPATNIVIGNPPVQIVHHEGSGGVGINRYRLINILGL